MSYKVFNNISTLQLKQMAFGSPLILCISNSLHAASQEPILGFRRRDSSRFHPSGLSYCISPLLFQTNVLWPLKRLWDMALITAGIYNLLLPLQTKQLRLGSE